MNSQLIVELRGRAGKAAQQKSYGLIAAGLGIFLTIGNATGGTGAPNATLGAFGIALLLGGAIWAWDRRKTENECYRSIDYIQHGG